MEEKYLKNAIKAMIEELQATLLLEMSYATKALRNEREQLVQTIRELAWKERVSFTLQEAAKATGLSYHTIYNKAMSGQLVVSQPGGGKGKMLVLKEDLLTFLRQYELSPRLNKRGNTKISER